MHKILILSQLLTLLTVACQYHSMPTDLKGDWYRTNGQKSSDYDLRIMDGGKVIFAQSTYKSPCIFSFDGDLINDSIYYETRLDCMKLQNREMENRYTKMDTFLVLEKSKASLKIFDLTHQKHLVYERSK